MSMWKILWLLFVSCRRQSVVMSLSLCEGNGVLECDETRNFSTFTCTGFTAQQTALWQLTYDTMIFTLGSCQPLTGGTSTCNPGSLPQVFQVSRTSATASSISAFSGAALSAFSEKGSLTCISQEGNDETTCLLDYIFPSSGSTCEVYFSTASTWSVVVNCSINKTRSVRARYTCQLRQHDQSGTTVLLPAVQMSVTQTSPDGYVSGVCNITSFLPSEGRYMYEVFITPGNVNVSANFIGNNTIHVPSFTPSHNCPLYADEGGSISCFCIVNDSGNPPGILRWENLNSNQLVLRDIQKSQNGMQSVCRLTWNNTVTQSVSYTLIVAYQPTEVNFTMNDIKSKNVSVMENSTFTMKCQAGGRPSPAMTVTKVNDNTVVKSSPEGNITVEDKRGEVTHTVVVAQCSDSDEYRCTAANSRGMKDQSVNLFVKCKPRKSSFDTSLTPPTILVGKSASFELIAYPTSVDVTKYFLGSNICSCETLANDDAFRVDCTPSSQAVYKLICTVTVMNVTSHTAGLYKAVVSNELGDVALIFEALPRNITECEKNDELESSYTQCHTAGMATGLGIGLGIAGVEATLFAIILFVIFWRRKNTTSKAKGGSKSEIDSSRQDISLGKLAEENPPKSPSGREESAYETVGNKETGQTAAYTNVQGGDFPPRKLSNKSGNVYDGLNLQDVGVNSPYASLK